MDAPAALNSVLKPGAGPAAPQSGAQRAGMAVLLAWGLLGPVACASYTSALGYRARRAVMEKRFDAFPALMKEAAETEPSSALSDPPRTVLTHFLDFAGHPDFFRLIDQWTQAGWVPDDMICAIRRAHFASARDSDPKAAARSAEICLARAREASETAGRDWEVRACLEEAPFLVDTSTATLKRYLRRVADGTEPRPFRIALLDGMTRVYITGARRLAENEGITEQEARARTVEVVEKQSERLRWIIDTAQPFIDAGLLAKGSARGVLEVENVAVPLGQSFVARYALSERSPDRDLAWGWISVMKRHKKISRILGLGLWNRRREPKRDTYWYACTRPPVTAHSELFGSVRELQAVTVRSATPVADLDALRTPYCIHEGNALSDIYGPFPAEAVARGYIASRYPGDDGRWVTVRVVGQHRLRAAKKKRPEDSAKEAGTTSERSTR